ncbi:hypothetical protein [Photobacterium sp. OFAV2-7]|nr:hypothetical protein [Photobacterium sp. OFAV2-7]MCG7584590.1 hypothetical protein [Photobacterium sp. OFAV2-7]
MKRTHWSQLTEQEAYSWLKYAVADNLADFGDTPQSGYVQVWLHRRRDRR